MKVATWNLDYRNTDELEDPLGDKLDALSGWIRNDAAYKDVELVKNALKSTSPENVNGSAYPAILSPAAHDRT